MNKNQAPKSVVELIKKKLNEKHLVNSYLEGKITLEELTKAGIKLVQPI